MSNRDPSLDLGNQVSDARQLSPDAIAYNAVYRFLSDPFYIEETGFTYYMPGKAVAWGCISASSLSPSDVMRLMIVEAGKKDFCQSDYGLVGLYVARNRRANELFPFFIEPSDAPESINGLRIQSADKLDKKIVTNLLGQLTIAADLYYLNSKRAKTPNWRGEALDYPDRLIERSLRK